jgi:hypothetical protein
MSNTSRRRTRRSLSILLSYAPVFRVRALCNRRGGSVSPLGCPTQTRKSCEGCCVEKPGNFAHPAFGPVESSPANFVVSLLRART